MADTQVAKVVAFITRPRPAGADLLVFDHPRAGVQLPAGTLERGEAPVDGARREAWEETGLDRLGLVQALGGGSFHFASEVETPAEWWVKTPDGGGLCWRCRWAALPDVQLVAPQREWLDAVLDRLTGPAACAPTPRRRMPAEPALVNETTVAVFWAPPFGGRWTLLSWLRPDEVRPASPSRALGVCFTAAGRVVLVTGHDRTHWNHPGGGREPGESLQETLVREVYEEACARVLASTLIGHERIVEIDSSGAVVGVDHHARFAARVALEPFVARHETVARTVVAVEEVPAVMPGWQPDSLRRLLDAATSAAPANIELSTAMDGVVLRELTPDHIEPYWALLDRNRDHLTRLGDYQDLAGITLEQAWAGLVEPTDLNTRFGLWRDGALIGRVDLIPVNPPNYVLGYWLDAGATGHGYATEGCRAALAFARSRLAAEVVWAGVTPGNDRSVAVLDRLGFERVADLEKHTRYRLVLG